MNNKWLFIYCNTTNRLSAQSAFFVFLLFFPLFVGDTGQRLMEEWLFDETVSSDVFFRRSLNDVLDFSGYGHIREKPEFQTHGLYRQHAQYVQT